MNLKRRAAAWFILSAVFLVIGLCSMSMFVTSIGQITGAGNPVYTNPGTGGWDSGDWGSEGPVVEDEQQEEDWWGDDSGDWGSDSGSWDEGGWGGGDSGSWDFGGGDGGSWDSGGSDSGSW